MCGRYAATLPPQMMQELFSLLNLVDVPPRFNIAPTQPIVVIRATPEGRVAGLFRWGLVPSWVGDPKDFPLLFNARSESMADKPAFRDALRLQRCIVPATGYYEWHTADDNTKTPYFVTMADGSPMLFAGLYASWVGPGGDVIDSAAIVTVPASADMTAIHPRMPAVLTGNAIERWLATDRVKAGEAMQLVLPLAPGAARFYRVSERVGSADNDDPSLLDEVAVPVTAAPRPRRQAVPDGQLDLF